MASNIKNQLFSGVFYTALAKYSGIVISLVIAGILARLLSPDDFGIVAVATVIIAFFSLLTDMGISPAIIQDHSLPEDELSTIFSFTVWTGIGISILFFAASWMIADYTKAKSCGHCVNCCPLIYSLPPPPSCREHYSIGTRNSNSSLSVVSLSRFPQVRQP